MCDIMFYVYIYEANVQIDAIFINKMHIWNLNKYIPA